jgi:hypothetical protein
VNPRERLHTPDDSGYHENQVSDGELGEVYQDAELMCSFNINLDLALNSLVGDANDVTLPEQVMWFGMLKSAKDQILAVDTRGELVSPRVRYGTTFLLIRYAMRCVSCSVEWGWHHTL